MRRIPRIRTDAAVLQPSLSLRSANPQQRLALALPSRTFTTAPASPAAPPRRSAWASPTSTQSRPYSSVPKHEKTSQAGPTEDAQLAEIEAASAELDQYAQPELTEPEIETDLIIPGQVQVAPRPNQVTDPEYTVAITGDGLEEVGGLEGYWEDDSHWDKSKEIQIFGRSSKVTDPAVLEVLTRQAVVEALAVQAQEDSDATLKASWARGGAAQRTAALGVHITVAEDGSASLSGNATSVVRGLAEDPSAEDAEASLDLMDAGEARELSKSWDASWKSASLQDAALKFAVTKRILQLTGHLLPDAKLAGTNTVGALLSVLVRPPKAKKLAEVIQSSELVKLPNVTVYDRRVTSIDKQKMVGRWKVIVAELERRELPVTGTGGYTKMVEHSWVDGGESIYLKEQRRKKFLKKRAAKNHATL